jgi:alpha-aminoadipic semialdehyde synthase
MRALNDRAIAANVLLLNEIGLDPGIDHCSAISLLERIKSGSSSTTGEKDKQIKSFVSFCGGLPAPELLKGDSDHFGYPSAGPLMYKFSWSPRGVLTAALNGARYRLGGKEIVVPGVGINSPSTAPSSKSTGGELLTNGFPEVDFSGSAVYDERLNAIDGMLEGLPNRDSVPYAEMYGLRNEDMRTLLRGTLRYKGFSSLLSFYHHLGMLENSKVIHFDFVDTTDPNDEGKGMYLEEAWLNYYKKVSRIPIDKVFFQKSNPEHAKALAWLLDSGTGTKLADVEARNPKGTQWWGLPPLEPIHSTPLDLFAKLLAHKLRYAKNERDIVVLVHEVIASCQDSQDEEEIHTSSLVIYGSDHGSAMARSVGIPVAIAALAVLDGAVEPLRATFNSTIPIRGVHGPGHASIRERVLEGLEKAGIGMKESVRRAKVGDESSLEAKLVAGRRKRGRAV